MNRELRHVRAAVASLLLALVLSGCASTPTEDDGTEANSDPWEGVNRQVFAFNETLDKYVLAPTARGWVAITPQAVRLGVDNFFDNAGYPGVVVNDLLQGKLTHAAMGSARFLINSTFGIAGLFDPATQMGFESRNEDFGQTLGWYGVDNEPYLVVPLFGPSSARDVTRYPVEFYTDTLTYASLSAIASGGLTLLNVVNTRAQLEGAMRLRNEAALDPYAFTRSSYLQWRRNQVYDGNPPVEDDPYGEFFDSQGAAPAVDNGG